MNSLDPIRLYRGADLPLTDKISLRLPTLGDVVDLGEERYFNVVQMLTAIPSDMKAPLWDVGIDWTEFSDLEMFAVMTANLPPDETRIFLGDLICAVSVCSRGRMVKSSLQIQNVIL